MITHTVADPAPANVSKADLYPATNLLVLENRQGLFSCPLLAGVQWCGGPASMLSLLAWDVGMCERRVCLVVVVFKFSTICTKYLP